MKLLRTALLAGAGMTAYAYAETKMLRLQRHRLEIPAGLPALDVLHISDTHLQGSDKDRIAYLRALPARVGTPDLVLATGDLIDNDSGIEPLLAALEGIEARYGRYYVLGSHDYYQTRFRLPFKYLVTKDPHVHELVPADTDRFEHGLQAQGWKSLTNRTEHLDTPFGEVRLAGVDDPYLKRDKHDHVERAGDEVLAIGLTHAPDHISNWVLNNFDLVVCGHTHGGQLRAPFAGALVTNSTLPCALAMGPNRVGNTWLHVSPGLGTAPHMRIRFLCRPEATVLELRPSS